MDLIYRVDRGIIWAHEKCTMSETAVLEAPAPSTIPAAPAAAPEKLNAATFIRDSDKVTPDVLSAMSPKWTPPKMFQRVSTEAAPAPAAEIAAPVPAPTPPAPEPAAVAPVEPPATPTPEPVADPKLAKNWRMQAEDAKEALVYQLRKSGVSLQEAVAEVYGAPPAAAPVAPATPISAPEPQADPVAKADQQITSLASQVAELEAQIDEKSAEDPKAAMQLMRKQADLKIALSKAQDQRESIAQQIEDRKVNTAVEEHRQIEGRAKTEMFDAYPQLADPKSEERAAFNIKVAQMKKDPAFGPSFMTNIPGWPIMVARMLDAEKGWSRAVTPPPAAPAPVAAPVTMTQPNPLAPKTVVAPPLASPVRATSAELLSSSNSPGAATPALDAKTFWKDSANVTPDQLIKLYAHAPIDPRLVRQQKTDPRRFDSP